MKKRNGFTLIELLAVIVILAIIALIATPLVLKYIESAREGAKERSAESYIRAVETEVAVKALRNQKYSNQCLTLEELNSKLDIDVKGEKPNVGEVCFDSDSTVTSATLTYKDNVTVEYVGGKASISKNAVVAESLYEAEFEFIVDDWESSAVVTIDSDLFSKFEVGKDYDIYLDGVNKGKFFAINFNIDGENGIMLGADTILEDSFIIRVYKDKIIVYYSGIELSGKHTIKISNPKDTNNKSFFYVNPKGEIYLASYDFVVGDANILITDSEGKEYYNGNNNISIDYDGVGIFGIDTVCRENFIYLPEVYTAIDSGKKIIIKVTQNTQGVDNVITLNFDNFNKNDNIYLPGGRSYYIGRTIYYMLNGC